MSVQLVIPIAVLLLGACGGGGGGATAADGTPRPARRQANLIGEEEIQGSARTNVYDVVQTLRPAWLTRSRPTTVRADQATPLLVYVDGARFGDVESLRQMSLSNVRTIRYFSPAEAQARFGPGHLQGAIEVTTRGQ